MQYIILLLLLIMSAGCVTTGSTIGTIPEVESERVIQSVGISQKEKQSEPPNWILGKEHSGFSNARYLVGIGFSNKIQYQQVSQQEQS